MQVLMCGDAWDDSADSRGQVAAICAKAARRAGLRPTDLEWVRLGERAVLRVDAGRVIARVERPGVDVADAAAEIGVARWLSTAGIPVTHPLPVDQPVVVDGAVVTFWYGVFGHQGSVEQLADLLLQVHALTPPPELARPARPFLRLRRRIARAPGLIEDERRRLAAVLDATAGEFRALQPELTPGYVHGDAACHNVLATPGGPVLFDFEYAGWGYREWDLAQTAAYHDIGWISEPGYRAFAGAYGRDVRAVPGYPVLRRARLLRELTGLAQRPGTAGDPTVRAEIQRRVTDLELGRPPSAWRRIAPVHPTHPTGGQP
ncbi:aminoglycoside phosphotransferase family protein [Amycolatopsis sp.]|uniref:phosphotransferase enzyme family protein n=1 Tax=Amycolatopsis sp. TaxID=37632 RepID=UPI002C8A47F7|nr:aminoglycoside phosphotransferase family protein [Amycolatopsis sp.]HVV08288.1 aminoglycoside phosphotransferase family protein [Amycolatopsis sp.]